MQEEQKFCLVTLSHEEIVQKWSYLSPLVQCSLPPTFSQTPVLMSNFLAATQTGAIELHVFGIESERLIPFALVGTMIFNDGVSQSKSMIIVCLTALKELNRPEIWETGVGFLKLLAKDRGCDALFAYSNVRSIIELIKSFGGTAEFTFLRIGV